MREREYAHKRKRKQHKHSNQNVLMQEIGTTSRKPQKSENIGTPTCATHIWSESVLCPQNQCYALCPITSSLWEALWFVTQQILLQPPPTHWKITYNVLNHCTGNWMQCNNKKCTFHWELNLYKIFSYCFLLLELQFLQFTWSSADDWQTVTRTGSGGLPTTQLQLLHCGLRFYFMGAEETKGFNGRESGCRSNSHQVRVQQQRQQGEMGVIYCLSGLLVASLPRF